VSAPSRQLDDVLSYFERHRAGEVLMGPAANRIAGELQQAVEKLDPLPGHVADPARVRAMLSHVAKTLFVGVFERLLLRALDGASASTATPSALRQPWPMSPRPPARTPASSNRHRPLWAKAIADGEELLKAKRLSPLQRGVISDDIKRYRGVIRKL